VRILVLPLLGWELLGFWAQEGKKTAIFAA
jgi:hypothetical protein